MCSSNIPAGNVQGCTELCGWMLETHTHARAWGGLPPVSHTFKMHFKCRWHIQSGGSVGCQREALSPCRMGRQETLQCLLHRTNCSQVSMGSCFCVGKAEIHSRICSCFHIILHCPVGLASVLQQANWFVNKRQSWWSENRWIIMQESSLPLCMSVLE